MLLLPGPTELGIAVLESPANGVFAHDLLHPQQLRVDLITAHRGDMRIALLSRQGRKQVGSQDIHLGRGIGAGVAQRTILHPG